MRSDLLLMALAVGAATWAFRYFPTRLDVSVLPKTGPLARFLAATGPAAIATLFVASVLPALRGGVPLPLVAGVLAVLAVYVWRKSVVMATLAGSGVYGAVFATLAA